MMRKAEKNKMKIVTAPASPKTRNVPAKRRTGLADADAGADADG